MNTQLEWLTGGECLAGMHEVVVTNRTLEVIERARQENRSLWRVSSTVSVIFSRNSFKTTPHVEVAGKDKPGLDLGA